MPQEWRCSLGGVVAAATFVACGIVPARNIKPVAQFDYTLPDRTHRQDSLNAWTVAFDATESFDPEGPDTPTQGSGAGLSAYVWDFGDGGSKLTLRTPMTSKTFNVDSGTFVVTLQVIDNDGESSEPFSQRLELRDNRPPIARFSVQVERSGHIFVATFDAGQSSDPDATTDEPLLYYSWNFGDGKHTQDEPNPVIQHEYEPGDYVVRLVVSDGLAYSTPAIQGIEVR